MATPNAVLSRHTTLKVKAASDVDFIAIGRLTTIPTPTPEAEEIDISALDSPGAFREFMRGAIDNGSIEVVGQYKAGEAGQKKLYDLFLTGEVIEIQIIAPDIDGVATPAQYEGNAYVSVCKPFGDAEEGSILPFNATLRLTGELTYTPEVLKP